MLRATRQLTTAPGRATPEPATAPETTWVVESGKPTCEEARMTDAATVSDPKPWGGRTSTTLVPRVLMIRQPPQYVPNAMAVAQLMTTHSGTRKLGPPAIVPLAINASEITPIVFWASLVPCASATIDDDATCPQRNSRSDRSGE